MPRRRLRACRECDLLTALPALRPGERAICPRCGCTLVRRFRHSAQRSLALALAALLTLGLAVSFPFVSFEYGGLGNRIELSQTATSLIGFHQPLVAFAVAMTIIILPACYLLAQAWLQFSLLRGGAGPYGRHLARTLIHLTPWMMADVFIVGALVSLVKIAATAEIGLDYGFWAFCAFALLLLFTTQSIDADWVWFSLAGEPRAPASVQTGQTASSQGVAGCDTCGLINALQAGGGSCRRCGDALHPRRPHSLQHTWALLCAAAILYIPANVYPIMQTVSLGRSTSSTIIGGIAELWQYGSWPIALVIFVASVVVPLAKLFVLGGLCLAVRYSAGFDAVLRTRLYRVTEFIGRWSMVDVFVVALLVALIRADALMSVSPGPAALAFCGVVILTMLAAITFDPRLLWDTDAAPIHPDARQSSGEVSA